MFNPWFRAVPVALVVLALDQVSKYFIEMWLIPYRELAVFEYFSLALSYNQGVAFGIFHDASSAVHVLLQIVILYIIGWLLYTLHKLKRSELPLLWPLALILGGALGNGVDRFLDGRIVDFLALHYEDWYWPTFNIADMAITIGAGLFIYQTLRKAWTA